MTPETVTIILPLPPRVLSPNCMIASIGGRFQKAAAAKKYRRLACEAVQAEQIESAPWESATIRADFYRKTKRRRDPDNDIASLKAAYDGIVDAGLLPDDDYAHLCRLPPSTDIDREYPRVVLTIMRQA
jgi:hypothetical protein